MWLKASRLAAHARVSMESGLEGRNNLAQLPGQTREPDVSMESGLEGRNNQSAAHE